MTNPAPEPLEERVKALMRDAVGGTRADLYARAGDPHWGLVMLGNEIDRIEYVIAMLRGLQDSVLEVAREVDELRRSGHASGARADS